MPTTKFGHVCKRDDGKTIVVFERILPHAVERVWAAITEAQQRAVWAPGIKFAPAPDAPFEIWFGDECEGPSHASGTLAAFEPPTRLHIASMRFALTAQADGCRLMFSDVLWYDDVRTRTEFANAVLAGWHRFLDTLEIWLDEGAPALDLAEPDYAAIDVPGRE